MLREMKWGPNQTYNQITNIKQIYLECRGYSMVPHIIHNAFSCYQNVMSYEAKIFLEASSGWGL